MSVHGDIEIERLSETEVQERRETVWRCCRWCNAEIPPSTPVNAYCDERCKKRSMIAEMS